MWSDGQDDVIWEVTHGEDDVEVALFYLRSIMACRPVSRLTHVYHRHAGLGPTSYHYATYVYLR